MITCVISHFWLLGELSLISLTLQKIREIPACGCFHRIALHISIVHFQTQLSESCMDLFSDIKLNFVAVLIS